ncbi:MAG TPA: hypothetical protein VIT00_13215 [Terrimicrobiaceae bacterium]
MKNIIRNILLLIAVFASMSSFTASALPPGKGGPLTPIKSREQAEKVPADATVVVACGSCQTVDVVKPGGILGLFSPSTKHLCPGCKGTITYVGAPGKGTTVGVYKHSCSKCGNASAYVCAGHRS